MPLIQLREATLSFGSAPVLDKATLQIDADERICLLGRNGAGKSSLMRVLSDEESLSSGEVYRQPNLKVARLDQEIPEGIRGTIHSVVHPGPDPSHHQEEWEIDLRIDQLLETMQLPSEAAFESLSGGMKRRVLLARALAHQPDLLLLDEPTNHLDVEAILWLEEFLLRSDLTIFFVTHDRAFLRKVATRILDLDRGSLTSWACGYDTYLERKQAALEIEEKQWAQQDRKLAQEESWLRQGVKARRTRNEGRVRALQKLRAERRQRRDRQDQARLELQSASTSGRKVIEAKNISYCYEGAPIISDFTTTIWRGDKIGIIGPNGSGKTTLLKVLLGELKPATGEVLHGTSLEVVYLDQMRAEIDPAKTLAENVAGSAEHVNFNNRSTHIHSYLKDFLFEPEQVRMPARLLSGGERNRLLLARLFLRPANLLILDEPTNDLDVETLELLEQLLVDYGNTLLLVSHDRTFLDNVVTSTIAFEGHGELVETIGGYSDWQQRRAEAAFKPEPRQAIEAEKPRSTPGRKKTRKFLNRERRELEELPETIERLESRHSEITDELADPDTYVKTPDRVAELEAESKRIETEIEQVFARWEALEAIRKECELEEAEAPGSPN